MSEHKVSISTQGKITKEKRPVQKSVKIMYGRSLHNLRLKTANQVTLNTHRKKSSKIQQMPLSSSKSGLIFPMIPLSHTSPVKEQIEVNREEVTRNDEKWNVVEVKEIDPFFPIERSHEIIDDMSASEIAMNVEEFLTAQSIDVVYDNEEAVAYAQTPTGCKFRVHLFKPNHRFNDKKGGSVLVEVQRRSGCCVIFHSLARQILCAARGCECPKYAIDTHHDLKCGFLEGFDKNVAPVHAK